MPKRFSERIIEVLSSPGYQPLRAKKLARQMGIAAAEMGGFHDAVDALRRVGRVVIGTDNALMLPQAAGQMIGTLRANPRGFAFVVPDEPTAHGDLFIGPGDSLDAVTGDRVLCQVMRRGKRDGKDRLGGRVLRILERGNSRFVGRLRREEALWYVQTDGNTLHAPILIGDPGAKGAKADDQVVVEITRYPSDGAPARGVIVERLGAHDEAGIDVESIVRQFHLPSAFPEAVLNEAGALARSYAPARVAEDREDLSDRIIITVDPDDARDYDDAISLVRLDGGDGSAGRARSNGRGRRSTAGGPAWELGVHIADVSTFVTPGSAIDDEAVKRGTSVYLPGRVIPMLPEVLSNEICSLQEGEPRLTKSAFIQYDAEGHVVGTRFANTVIRSHKRLTYGQATGILEGRRGGFDKRVIELVQNMDALARAIQKRRIADGMIELDLPAVDLILDEDGRVVDARPEDTSFSHKIIEMFMVEANEAIARLLHSHEVPFIRRVHPEPDEESLEGMARLVRAGGLKLPARIEPRDLQKLLHTLHGKPGAYAVNLAVLRSMQMAEYSPKRIGHFALASEDYAHFTSPIRRYPDLMVHRLLDEFLGGQLGEGRRGRRGRTAAKRVGRGGDGRAKGHAGGTGEKDPLAEIARQLSYLSRRAESAERELKTVKVLSLLEKQVGEEFEGVVTGVTNFGLFVQHPKYLIDGLLRLEDLGDDWWEVDVKAGRVMGERSRKTYALGATVHVRIADVDVPGRELELALIGVESRGRKAGSSRRGPSAARPQGRDGRTRAGTPSTRPSGAGPRRPTGAGNQGRSQPSRRKGHRKGGRKRR